MKYLKTYESKESEINMDWFISTTEGDLETIKKWIKSGIDINCKTTIGKTALYYAIEHANLETIKELIDNGADVNVRFRDIPLILIEPIKNKNEIRKLLIDSGIDLCQKDNNGYTPLYKFIVNTKYKDVLFLIKNCKDKKCLEIKNNNGDTILHLSSYHENEKLVNELIRQKVDVNCTNNQGITPLLLSSSLGYSNLVKKLIDSGANINSIQNDGSTPLICAAEMSNIEIVEMLLTKVADLSIINNDNMCAFNYIKDFWKEEYVQEQIMQTQPHIAPLMKKYIKIHPNIEEKYSVYFDMGDIGLF
ncbi:ankyrin repeat domain-containing protein [bacterium]|jgi:ankyrin repeat protein|nr:ankyrin repeat domain-containing protein [bacterium]